MLLPAPVALLQVDAKFSSAQLCLVLLSSAWVTFSESPKTPSSGKTCVNPQGNLVSPAVQRDASRRAKLGRAEEMPRMPVKCRHVEVTWGTHNGHRVPGGCVTTQGAAWLPVPHPPLDRMTGKESPSSIPSSY